MPSEMQHMRQQQACRLHSMIATCVACIVPTAVLYACASEISPMPVVIGA